MQETTAKSYDEAMPFLAAPFAPEEIDFISLGGKILPYTDARAVRRRLNMVAGSDWSSRLIPVGETDLICELTIFGITRADASGERGFASQDMIKGAASGALKRAAFSHQIGEYLYDLPTYRSTGPLGVREVKMLRQRYIEWLQTEGIKRYGHPMDCDTIMCEDDPIILAHAPRYLDLLAQARRALDANLLTKEELDALIEELVEHENLPTRRVDFWNARARMSLLERLELRENMHTEDEDLVDLDDLQVAI